MRRVVECSVWSGVVCCTFCAGAFAGGADDGRRARGGTRRDRDELHIVNRSLLRGGGGRGGGGGRRVDGRDRSSVGLGGWRSFAGLLSGAGPRGSLSGREGERGLSLTPRLTHRGGGQWEIEQQRWERVRRVRAIHLVRCARSSRGGVGSWCEEAVLCAMMIMGCCGAAAVVAVSPTSLLSLLKREAPKLPRMLTAHTPPEPHHPLPPCCARGETIGTLHKSVAPSVCGGLPQLTAHLTHLISLLILFHEATRAAHFTHRLFATSVCGGLPM